MDMDMHVCMLHVACACACTCTCARAVHIRRTRGSHAAPARALCGSHAAHPPARCAGSTPRPPGTRRRLSRGCCATRWPRVCRRGMSNACVRASASWGGSVATWRRGMSAGACPAESCYGLPRIAGLAGLLGLALQAHGCATHSGRAAEPRRAQSERLRCGRDAPQPIIHGAPH